MKDKELNVFCSNVRGLVNNWSSIKKIKWDDYDIIGFNEIWGIKNYENLRIEGYEIKCQKIRESSRGGGTLIFGKKTLPTKVLNTPFVEGCFESTGVSIGKVIFLNIYRPPSGNKDEFVNILTQYLDTVRGQKLLIGGDFNFDTTNGNAFMNTICNLYGLRIEINSVTRVDSGTCIDNYLSNIEGVYSVSDICIADHQAIVAKVKIETIKLRSNERFYYRQMKEDNWLTFKCGINSIVIYGESVNDKWNNLLNDVKNVVENSFPLKESKKMYLFTMSQGLLKSRDKKNKLLAQFKRGLIDRSVYTEYNKVYRKLIWTEQSKEFKNKMEEAGGSGKKKWKVLKEKLLIEKESIKINEICKDGVFLTNKEDIASAFKNHFETCASNLSQGLPQGHDTSVVMPLGDSWQLEHTNEIELLKIIKSLKNKNSCGIDCLSNRMLKREPHAFSRLIVDLINTSIDEGCFPDCLKTAKIIPVFKKGDRSNLNNYRPIALLPVLSKVFEKVINNQLNSVIEDKFIDDNQFGFRNAHSTEDAVLKFVDKVQKDLSLKLHVVTVFVDVSKAFDSCDHSILIKKIKRTGLNDNGIKLFESYLLDRKQFVEVDGMGGGYFVINIGVGQGTILGPTFFKIYIMDMHLCTTMFCVKFADDSSFEGSARTRDEVETYVNNELVKIAKWFCDNRLTLHPDKSRVLIHSRDKLINISLNNTPVQRCGYGLQEESVKLLGIHIDENLDWEVHIKSVVKKISKGNYLLWRYKKTLNNITKKVIYESFVRSHLLYGLSVWGGASKAKMSALEKTLHKIWRKFGSRYEHTNERLVSNKILKLEDELQIQESKLLWKWNFKKLPKSLFNIIQEKQDRLRGRRFVISRTLKSNSINLRLTKLANSQIGNISSFKSKKSLSHYLKNCALDRYIIPCRTRNCFICVNRNT